LSWHLLVCGHRINEVTTATLGPLPLVRPPKSKPTDSQPSSPPACTAPSFATRTTGRPTRLLPAAPFENRRLNASEVRLPVRPDRRRQLETAFRSLVTIVCCQTAITRSKLPTYSFAALQSLPRARSVSHSAALPGYPDWATSTFKTRCPIPALPFRSRPGSPLPFRALSNPSGSTRSTRFPTGKRTFQPRPISLRSPLPFLLE